MWGCLTLSLPLAWCLPRRGDQAIRYYSSPDVLQRFPFLDEAYPIHFNKSQLLPEGWRWSGLLALICSYVMRNLWWAQSCLRSPSFKVFLQSFGEICASIHVWNGKWLKALPVSICRQGQAQIQCRHLQALHRSSLGWASTLWQCSCLWVPPAGHASSQLGTSLWPWHVSLLDSYEHHHRVGTSCVPCHLSQQMQRL